MVRKLEAAGRENVPPTGPTLILSNHPGMADTISLFASLPRPDLRIIVNDRPFLQALPNVSRYLLYVPAAGDADKTPAIRAVVKHLRQGGAVLTFPAGRIEPDRAIDSLVRAVTDPIQPLINRPIATVAEPMSGQVLGNFMADVYRAIGGGDVAVMNRGGVRAALDTGTVTYGELYEVAPFGNMLVRLTISGRGLRQWLERAVGQPVMRAHLSGLSVVYDTTLAPGRRVVSVMMAGGGPLTDNGTYRMIYSDFLHAGGDGLNATEGIERVEELGIVDIDALQEYLRSTKSPVWPPLDERVTIRRP